MNDLNSPGSSGMMSIIEKMTGDMKIVGIYQIIVGGLSCLTIIGALIGVPMIIAGLRARESANSYSNYLDSDDQADLGDATDKLAGFFFMHKVLVFIYVGFFILYLLFILLFGAAMFTSMMNMSGGGY